jgi:hypothetical protein
MEIEYKAVTIHQKTGDLEENTEVLVPDVELPAQEPVGLWGQRHLRFIREQRRALYDELVLSGTLNAYLVDIDREAADLFLRLVDQMKQAEGVTEQLKADDPMAWVRRMNSIRSRVEEAVNHELVFA